MNAEIVEKKFKAGAKNHSISVKSFYRWQRMIRKEAFDLLPEVTKQKILNENKQSVSESSPFVRISSSSNTKIPDASITI